MGFKLGFFPVRPPEVKDSWQYEEWDPVWEALEENDMVLGFHIGTEPVDPTGRIGRYYRGRGGAVLNYVETTYGGQRAVSQLIAAGALDRHPGLRILVSEGGATWGPFLADRMDEGYRQHGAAVRPKLSKLPSEYLYTQVYASFQHDRSAVLASTAMGWQNVMWGSRLPPLRGHLRPHSKDAARALRRHLPRGEPSDPHRGVPGAVPPRPRPSRGLSAHTRSTRASTARARPTVVPRHPPR